jgi:hypothetical protein
VGSLASTTTLALPGGASTAIFRNSITLTATVDQPGKVTFYSENKRISGCINVPVSNSSATCSWRPSTRGLARLSAILTPNNGYSASKGAIEVRVSSRTSPR